MATKKDVDDLQGLIAGGDLWLRKYGFVDNPVAHNSIIANLYGRFPRVKFVEYFLNPDPEERKIEVVLHFSFWYLLFRNKDKLIEDAIDLLRDYLHDFSITVTLKRFKKGANK